ncbi:MAG: isoaspartyl peptidase/L-asparaginase, partial [Sphingomonadaceae bacterium]|nr:isoaspartyl peptidase/L-asparaginase [Sphingomonadaceae bacterium]
MTMLRFMLAPILALFAVPAAAEEPPRWSIAIHGGAGTLSKAQMTPERQAEYEAALQGALDAGARVL